jgi:hypothetical protein
MAQGNIAKLPKLGEITLPVHLMTYDDKENPDKDFRSGFAYWWAADGTSDVSDNDGNVIGMIGGKMGGHVEMSRYYPHNGQPHDTGKYKQWASVIIDVRDIWDQIEALLDSDQVKIQLEGMDEVYAKYKALQESEREEKDKLDKRLEEVLQMQKEEDEKREKEEKLAQIASTLKDKSEPEFTQEFPKLNPGDEGYEGSKWDLEKRFGSVHGTYMIKDTEIYEDGNWDLTETLNARDEDFYEYKESEGVKSNRDANGKIPVNIGCGCLFRDTRYKTNKMMYTDSIRRGGRDTEVSLRITSYIGISPGAIHYYGTLNFNTPDVHPEGQPTTSTSVFDLNLFNGGNIQLTRKLESWEFEKYKKEKTYKGWRPGDSYSGFYTEEDVIERGKQVFQDLFGEGWELKIEEY